MDDKLLEELASNEAFATFANCFVEMMAEKGDIRAKITILGNNITDKICEKIQDPTVNNQKSKEFYDAAFTLLENINRSIDLFLQERGE